MDGGLVRAVVGSWVGRVGLRGRGPVVTLLAAITAVAAAGCASTPTPEPPSPVVVEDPGAHPGPPEGRPAPGGGMEPPAAVVPRAPWIPPAVALSPAEPREGTAMAVRLVRPRAGREPLALTGEVAGVPIRFARSEEGWIGIAALPIGSDGPQLLSIGFRVGPDSTADWIEPVHVRSRKFPATTLRVAPRYARPPPSVEERIRREREMVRATLETVTPEWLVDAPFDWPRPPQMTSPFGQRRLFNGELRSRHWGLDLRGGTGAPVRAAASGRVALVGDLYYQGTAVYVDHGLGVYTGYFHLSGVEVEEGGEVVRGQLLGAVGATGRVTGPHLHWSLYVAGENLDPASLLELDLPPVVSGRTAGGAGSP